MPFAATRDSWRSSRFARRTMPSRRPRGSTGNAQVLRLRSPPDDKAHGRRIGANLTREPGNDRSVADVLALHQVSDHGPHLWRPRRSDLFGGLLRDGPERPVEVD